MENIEKYLVLVLITFSFLYCLYYFFKGWGVGRQSYIWIKPNKTNFANRLSMFFLVMGLGVINLILAVNISSNWKIYSNSIYSIKYPSNWTVNTSDSIVMITKNDLTFQIISREADSSPIKYPYVCGFSDTNYKSSIDVKNNFTEIISGENIYRILPPMPVIPGPGGEMKVCYKKVGDEVFTDKIGLINIGYLVPEEYSHQDFKTMNQMLSTFKFNK